MKGLSNKQPKIVLGSIQVLKMMLQWVYDISLFNQTWTLTETYSVATWHQPHPPLLALLALCLIWLELYGMQACMFASMYVCMYACVYVCMYWHVVCSTESLVLRWWTWSYWWKLFQLCLRTATRTSEQRYMHEYSHMNNQRTTAQDACMCVGLHLMVQILMTSISQGCRFFNQSSHPLTCY